MALNQALYDRLRQVYGRVTIANAGERMVARHTTDAKGAPDLVISSFGESYCVDCPGCKEHRQRLWISHRWGDHDAIMDRRLYTLMTCFNENCQSRPGFIPSVVRQVGMEDGPLVRAGREAGRTPLPTEAEAPVSEVASPGLLTPLTLLADDHPAVLFLRNRGFNPRWLSEHWGMRWCEESQHPQVKDRLVVSVYARDEGRSQLVGWQARFVGDGSGDCKNHWLCRGCQHTWVNLDEKSPDACPSCGGDRLDRVAKWFTGPGTKKSKLLFNYEEARGWPFGVVVEGPMDAIRVGSPTSVGRPGPAVAVFGHTFGQVQRTMIFSNMQWRYGVIYLMFDGDLWHRPAEAAKLATLEAEVKASGQVVVVVRLPKDKDPGDMTHREIWDTLAAQSIAAGVEPPWLKEPA